MAEGGGIFALSALQFLSIYKDGGFVTWLSSEDRFLVELSWQWLDSAAYSAGSLLQALY